MTPEDYYRLLYQYNYIRPLPAIPTSPSTAPLSLHFFFGIIGFCGFYSDYQRLAITHNHHTWYRMEQVYYYPGFDAILLFMDRFSAGMSGCFVELADVSGYTSFSLERYAGTNLSRFSVYDSWTNDKTDLSVTIHGFTQDETYRCTAVQSCTVDSQQITKAFFDAMRFAYGPQLVSIGRRLLYDEFYTEAIEEAKDPLTHNLPSDDPDDDSSLTAMQKSIAYWNWIRTFPGLFPIPQPLLGLSDFFTKEEINRLSPSPTQDLYAPIPPAPILSCLKGRITNL